ncbi:M13 family metallopeptidase [Solitalea sp. MAHUQ-68]|uniref:M13 family metallopeptidase n=1 Tax=Solitalea agri TaxID=2953739 RepID=A0A9X2F6Q3_9SPHI|nr:M13 family metallopeptidase [Solitalea agri]MCO4293371.1 M13 family metallopeptidase [Solitalea agri]
MNLLKATVHVLLWGTIASALVACKQTPKSTIDIVKTDIDSTASPSKDFFLYANGNWIKNNPIPAAYSRWGIGNLVNDEIYDKLKKINEDAAKASAEAGSNTQKIGDFWLAGMDTVEIEKQGIKPIEADLNRINAIKDIQGVLTEVAYQHTLTNEPLFSLGVYQDMKNSEVMALYINQGGIGLPDRDYYFNADNRTKSIRDDYRQQHLPKMFKLSGLDESTAKTAAEGTYKLEEGLAKASRKLEALRDPYANYNKMSVSDLNKLTPSINWNDLLVKMKIKKVDSIIVGQPEFLKQVEQSLKTVSVNDWKNYLRWNYVTSAASYLNKSIDDENFRFYGTVLTGKKAQRPRWKRVLSSEESVMGEVLGQLYVEQYYSAKTKKRYEDLVEAIRDAYKERIQKLDWMSNETKKKAQEKLASMTKKVGYPDKWKDFSALKIDRSAYVTNMKRGSEFWYDYNVNKLGKPVDRTEWDMTPQTYNAYYNPSNNEIVLPAGIFLIPGWNDEDIDDAVVYGYAAASTIGHEITHGFDDQGSQFDAKGNLKKWWTKEDEAKFKDRCKMIVKQFNEFKVLDSMHVNGDATQGENIADLGGILLGWDAFVKTEQYKKGEKINGLTPAQRYFLGYALGWLGHQRDESLANQIMTDVHAPANLRVNGPFANIPAFYEAFGIKQGDPMWRADSLRVNIW